MFLLGILLASNPFLELNVRDGEGAYHCRVQLRVVTLRGRHCHSKRHQ